MTLVTDKIQSQHYESLATHDLHYHYDGSITPEIVQMAFRDSKAAGQEALALIEGAVFHKPVRNPQEFFNTFQKVMSVFGLSGSVYPLLAAQFEAARAEGIVHLDYRFGCGALSSRLNLSEAAVLGEFKRAVAHAKQLGLDVCPTLCFSRYETMQRAGHLKEFVLANRDFIRAIDLEGQEEPNCTEAFALIFQELKDAGLRITIHAGEFSSSKAIWHAIDECGAERVGHGFSAVKDSALIRRLARDEIPVEVSLTSNFIMGLCSDLKSHPFLKMLSAGIPVVLCTDDKALFQTSLVKEYAKAASILTGAGYRAESLLQEISKNSRRFAFTERPT